MASYTLRTFSVINLLTYKMRHLRDTWISHIHDNILMKKLMFSERSVLRYLCFIKMFLQLLTFAWLMFRQPCVIMLSAYCWFRSGVLISHVFQFFPIARNIFCLQCDLRRIQRLHINHVSPWTVHTHAYIWQLRYVKRKFLNKFSVNLMYCV